MNRIARYYWIAKGVGWDNIPRRMLQAFRVRSGRLRKRLDSKHYTDEAFRNECSVTVDDQPRLWAQKARRFFSIPSAEALRSVTDDELWREKVTAVCEKALAGEYLFFHRWYGQLGWPPDFNLDPVNNVHWDVGKHWLDGPDSLHGGTDIKLVWEASRFSLAYYFARAYARDGNETWAEAFWAMFDAWIEQNPPEHSAAWRCGQEMTFRLMALLTAAISMLPSPATTPERLYALTRLVWQTGRHISVNINVGLMQENNHGISEAVGLMTAGLLFPEFRQAETWIQRGRKYVTHEIRRQVYDDGSFVQHSLNYHRVMMDDMLWATQLSELNNRPLPRVARDRFRRATRWLCEMIDPVSGRVPNYGNNDGASVLPMSCCDYLNYRPTAQAASLLLEGKRLFTPGPWDEIALWLLGKEKTAAGKQSEIRNQKSEMFSDGGYYILRGSNSWAMTHCCTYRDRPSHCDMLHVDMWYKGVNVLRDGGTFSYNAQEPWQSYFRSTAGHNTVQIDGAEQMTKGPRFTWFHWPRAKCLRWDTRKEIHTDLFVAEQASYLRQTGVLHRRSICRVGDMYIILDDLFGSGTHDIALRWRLCPADWQQQLQETSHRIRWSAEVAGDNVSILLIPQEGMYCELIEGKDSPTPAGWESLYYGEKQPVPVIIAEGRNNVPLNIATVISPSSEPNLKTGSLESVLERIRHIISDETNMNNIVDSPLSQENPS